MSHPGRLTFSYGQLDITTYWLKTPSGWLGRINRDSLMFLLDLHRGATLIEAARKYNFGIEEAESFLSVLKNQSVLAENGEGRISQVFQKEDSNPFSMILFFALSLGIQLIYFLWWGRTHYLQTWPEAIAVFVASILAIVFHEWGHRAMFKYFLGFSPRLSLGMSFIFPTVNVETHLAWCLPKNQRLLINLAGLAMDSLINVLAVGWVFFDQRMEYFVTPFLLTQYMRWVMIVNPLIPGDGYWILSDGLGVVHLAEESRLHLRKTMVDGYSSFRVMSLLFQGLSLVGLIFFVWHLFGRLFGMVSPSLLRLIAR